MHAGSSLISVGYISLGEHYHVRPVNICWLQHLTDARLDINFCYHIFTHAFNMYVYLYVV